MQDDHTLPFLGPCEVCGKVNRNYTQLALHLGGGRRKKPVDSDHLALRGRWKKWREGYYYRQSHCVKCGDLFEVTDKKDKRKRRCDRCIDLQRRLSKRDYEALVFNRPKHMPRAKKTTYRLPKTYCSSTKWKEGGTLYLQVEKALSEGLLLKDIVHGGVPLPVAQEITRFILGDGWEGWRSETRRKTMVQSMVKARLGSGLERLFVEQMRDCGVEPCGLNVWMTLPVNGKKVHREADIKIAMGSGKAIVLCDGMVFHGPGTIHGDPAVKMADDEATALAMYDMGYTVLRYSGDEIKSGFAIGHLLQVLVKDTQVCRLWC